VAAGLTLIFVNRHNRILQKQNFSYNRLCSSNVKQCKNRNPIVIIIARNLIYFRVFDFSCFRGNSFRLKIF
jgi:hypothetical protein